MSTKEINHVKQLSSGKIASPENTLNENLPKTQQGAELERHSRKSRVKFTRTPEVFKLFLGGKHQDLTDNCKHETGK